MLHAMLRKPRIMLEKNLKKILEASCIALWRTGLGEQKDFERLLCLEPLFSKF